MKCWCAVKKLLIHSPIHRRFNTISLGIFSRSYCYTVWSTIGGILWSVRLSVALCIVALRSVYRAKSCTVMFLACSTIDCELLVMIFIRGTLECSDIRWSCRHDWSIKRQCATSSMYSCCNWERTRGCIGGAGWSPVSCRAAHQSAAWHRTSDNISLHRGTQSCFR